MKLTATTIHGLEWHDGWLASIINTKDGRMFVSLAAAADWNQNAFCFALCQISRTQADRLIRHHSVNGFCSSFNNEWRNVLSTPNAFLSNVQPQENTEIICSEASVTQRERLNSYELPLVEKASSPEAHRFWLFNE